MSMPSSLPSTLETFLMHAPVSPMCDSSSVPLMEPVKVSQTIDSVQVVQSGTDSATLDDLSPQLLEVGYVKDQVPNKRKELFRLPQNNKAILI